MPEQTIFEYQKIFLLSHRLAVIGAILLVLFFQPPTRVPRARSSTSFGSLAITPNAIICLG